MTLPSDLSNERIVCALERAGFTIREGAKHTVARKAPLRTTIPRHRRVRLSTLKKIVEQAGLSPEQFLELL